MAVNISQPFHRTSAKPIDDSIVLTLAQMKAINDNLMPSHYFAVCQDDGQMYIYDKSATPTTTSGKFKKIESGEGGSSPYVYKSSALLDKVVNSSTDILISTLVRVDNNLIVPTKDDLTIGKTAVSDSDGTLGIVVDIKNDDTASVLTMNAGPGELTSEQLSALVEILS